MESTKYPNSNWTGMNQGQQFEINFLYLNKGGFTFLLIINQLNFTYI